MARARRCGSPSARFAASRGRGTEARPRHEAPKTGLVDVPALMSSYCRISEVWVRLLSPRADTTDLANDNRAGPFRATPLMSELVAYLHSVYAWLPELERYFGHAGVTPASAAFASEGVYLTDSPEIAVVDLERPGGGSTVVAFQTSDFTRLGAWDIDDLVEGVRVRDRSIYVATSRGSNYETYGQLFRIRGTGPPAPLLRNAWAVLDCDPAPLGLDVLLGGKHENDGLAYALRIEHEPAAPVDVVGLATVAFPARFTERRRPGGVLNQVWATDSWRRHVLGLPPPSD